MITAIDHVQLAIPPEGEDAARHFWIELMGFTELPRPAMLAGRPGAWFISGAAAIHVGVEQDFGSARKAHPALACTNFDELLARLAAAGHPADIAETLDQPAPASGLRPPAKPSPDGRRRAFTADPFNNRIELVEATV
jgi:hypothetical protein